MQVLVPHGEVDYLHPDSVGLLLLVHVGLVPVQQVSQCLPPLVAGVGQELAVLEDEAVGEEEHVLAHDALELVDPVLVGDFGALEGEVEFLNALPDHVEVDVGGQGDLLLGLAPEVLLLHALDALVVEALATLGGLEDQVLLLQEGLQLLQFGVLPGQLLLQRLYALLGPLPNGLLQVDDFVAE